MQSYTFLQAISSLLHMRVPFVFLLSAFFCIGKKGLHFAKRYSLKRGKISFYRLFVLSPAPRPPPHHYHSKVFDFGPKLSLSTFSSCATSSIFSVTIRSVHGYMKHHEVSERVIRQPNYHKSKRAEVTTNQLHSNHCSFKLSNTIDSGWMKKKWIPSLSSIHSNSNSFH